MNGPSISERFHRETKYIEGEMDKFAVPRMHQPPPEPFKNYHTEQAIDLIPYLPFSSHPFTGDAMPEGAPDATPEGLIGISRLLYFSNGVTGIMVGPDGTQHYYRAAPSAGALYPTEIYLMVHGLNDIADGIYNYQVRDHSLAPVWEGDYWGRLAGATQANGAVEQAHVALLLTGCWQRGTWRYGERAYRRALLDTGHVLGNTVAIAPSCGYGAFPLGGFVDASINSLLMVDDTDEAAVALVALPRLDALDLAAAGGPVTLPSPVSAGHLAGDSLLTSLHRAGYVTDPADQGTPAPSVEPPYADADEVIALDHEPLDWGNTGIERTILQRRSARSFDPLGMNFQELGALLSYAYQPALPSASGGVRQMFDATLLDTYIIVNRSDDVTPGIYFYEPASHQLRLLRAGDYADASLHICLGQDLAHDAAALVIHTADLDAVIQRHGDRGYRYLHLDAGHIGERLGLGALNLELGSSGIGGFYDNDVTRLLGLSERHVVAYITTLGVPPATD